ncbi:hypothetical protein [Azohydromonas aeria]|nr:hypothetical protein [Azohydromonas aeria]
MQALQDYWETISPQFPNVDDIRVIGIELTRRFKSPLDTAAH